MIERARRPRRRPPGTRWLVLLVAGWAPAATAGGLVVVTGAELDRAGAAVAVALPNGAIASGPAMLQACAPLVPGESDLVVWAVDTGTCAVASNLTEAVARADVSPVLALGSVDAATAAECLSHRAALFVESAAGGVLYCLGWSECPALAVAITGTAAVCAGDEAHLDAGAGWASYLWSPGGETTPSLDVSPAETTLYQVTVSDAQHCTGTDAFTVTVHPLPQPQITGATEICSGAETVLDAGAGWTSYLWSPGGATTRTLTAAPPTSTAYHVEVLDANGCAGVSAPHLLTVVDCSSVFTGSFEDGTFAGWSAAVP